MSLLVVSCTRAKSDEEFKTRPLSAGLMDLVAFRHIEFQLFYNNTRGLTTCYNEVLKDPKNLDKTVLFVHDDVEIQDLFLAEKLLTSPYSITGIAGAKTFSKASPMAAWHIASASDQYVGEAGHANKEGKVWTTVFGPTKSRALVLDGLFLSCKVRDLVDKGVEFDETLSFHHYDLSFCLRAHEKRVTCGVLPVHVVHHGLGDSMNSEEWRKSNEQFRRDYCK